MLARGKVINCDGHLSVLKCQVFIGTKNVSLAIDNISLANKLENFHWHSYFIGSSKSFIGSSKSFIGSSNSFIGKM